MGRLTAHPSIGVALARLREGLPVTRIPLTADQCAALIDELELRERARAGAEALAAERLSNWMDERKRANLAEQERDEALKRVTDWENAQLSADAFAGAEHRPAEAAVAALAGREQRLRDLREPIEAAMRWIGGKAVMVPGSRRHSSALAGVLLALAAPNAAADEPTATPGDLRPLLLEWLSYTGLRRRAFADEAVEGGEYESGRDLVRRTDAALAERP